MDVSGIKTAQLSVPGGIIGGIDDTEKNKVVNQQEDIIHSEKIIEELGEKSIRENTKKTKPQLNGKQSGRQHDDKTSAKKCQSVNCFHYYLTTFPVSRSKMQE
ncbi:hypothetical protein CKG00_12635 [Morganella morganii]|uniref:Uncharacterized protein n=1 Tax=Morganella morganii TaxID=582 RepID=A0A433ZYA8_MORMO|nr:hypothetical protein [Morganella morganii]RUT67120.1 hypothetical protein CKG00_12635 [Morganella morganii]